MAKDNKDRMGDKLRDVEAAHEDQWARKRDAELLAQMRNKLAANMVCPKCKGALTAEVRGGVEIYACPQGDGAWLDQNALDAALKLV